MSPNGIVIIGAGEAGARAAISLREQGFAGPVTLIGDERHLPYERPPLSKATLVDEAGPSLPVIADAAGLEARGIERRAGVAVTAIDRANRRLALGGGGALAYDQLVLATGATPRRPNFPGAERGVYLRSYDDALALRARFTPQARIVIVGAGFIGLELAASARKLGCIVTVVEVGQRILMRGVPAELAALIAERHIREGVDLRLGVGVAAIEGAGDAQVLRLADGDGIAADCIIIGIGALPATGLAEAADLEIDNGVKVDGRLATSDPAIYAIGDCASFPHALYGGRRVRLEAWRNAQDQGRFVAASLTGGTDAYVAVPWFWTDQYDLHLQIAGLADAAVSTIGRDLGDGARLLFHLDGAGRLVAASTLGELGRVAKDARLAEMLVAKRAHPDPDALGSPAVKLKSLLAA